MQYRSTSQKHDMRALFLTIISAYPCRSLPQQSLGETWAPVTRWTPTKLHWSRRKCLSVLAMLVEDELITLKPTLTSDEVHPTQRGYQVFNLQQ